LPTPQLQIKPAGRVCLNELITFVGGGGAQYSWSGPEGLYYQGQTVTVSASGLFQAGTYTLKVTDETGCFNTATTSLIIDPLPEGDIKGVLEGCAPLCSQYSFQTDFNAAKVRSLWQIGKQMFDNKIGRAHV